MSKTRRSFAAAARKVERLAREEGRALKQGSGMRMIGEEIMTDVKASRPGHGVPLDEGPLRASGRVTGPNARGAVRLSFGGAAAPYALKQHEDLTLHHDVGEARYLVRGVERWAPDGSAAVAALRANAEAAARRAAST